MEGHEIESTRWGQIREEHQILGEEFNLLTGHVPSIENSKWRILHLKKRSSMGKVYLLL